MLRVLPLCPGCREMVRWRFAALTSAAPMVATARGPEPHDERCEFRVSARMSRAVHEEAGMENGMQYVGEGAGMMPMAESMGRGENPRWRRLTEPEVFDIAQACHEANRLYRATLGEEMGPAWMASDAETKGSAMEGVRAYLGESGKIANFQGSVEQENHERWLERKLRAGWRYGEVKDTEQKQHPCLLPYRALPPAQRRKDVLFAAICSALDPRREV